MSAGGIRCAASALAFLTACAQGGVGARCARGNSNTPQSVVQCESGLSCCGLPDTGGTCTEPDGGAACPSGEIQLGS